MDIRLEYVNMCEQAKEIQEQSPRIAEYKCNEYTNKYYYYDLIMTRKHIWLPMQEDLQKIYKKHCNLSDNTNWAMVILDDFQEWVLEKCPDWMINFDTLEKYWLGFVMNIVYNKW